MTMPALRAHLIFTAAVRETLPAALAAAGAAMAVHWPATLLGALAPDVWYIAGGRRIDLHGLDKADPATWPGAIPRWLDAHPALRPGRQLPSETAAFMIGYLVHLGLDTWAQYQDAALPDDARRTAPAAWFPWALAPVSRLQAALQALAEAPFPASLRPAPDEVAGAAVPAGFAAGAIKRMTASMLPSLDLDDPWAMSRIHPWRELPATEAARREWTQRRAARAPATPNEYAALLHAASDFTLAALRDWW